MEHRVGDVEAGVHAREAPKGSIGGQSAKWSMIEQEWSGIRGLAIGRSLLIHCTKRRDRCEGG